MKTEIFIDKVIIDNAENIIKELEIGNNFQIRIYDSTEDEPSVGMWLEHYDTSKDCTIMFELTREQALFFGKSLTALAESLKK